MSIDVGGYQLDKAYTAVREAYEVVGGRQTRAIHITGLLRGVGNLATLIEALDGIATAVSETVPTEIVLRTGRRLFARRERFVREVSTRALIGQFVLELRADDAWEEAQIEQAVEWEIGLSGATLDLTSEGTADAMPIITLVAEGTLITPAVGDGARTLDYEGNVPNGATLIIDGTTRRVLLDDLDVTPYTSGDFPVLRPGLTTVEYTDDPASSHLVSATVRYRDRWW